MIGKLLDKVVNNLVVFRIILDHNGLTERSDFNAMIRSLLITSMIAFIPLLVIFHSSLHFTVILCLLLFSFFASPLIYYVIYLTFGSDKVSKAKSTIDEYLDIVFYLIKKKLDLPIPDKERNVCNLVAVLDSRYKYSFIKNLMDIIITIEVEHEGKTYPIGRDKKILLEIEKALDDPEKVTVLELYHNKVPKKVTMLLNKAYVNALKSPYPSMTLDIKASVGYMKLQGYIDMKRTQY